MLQMQFSFLYLEDKVCLEVGVVLEPWFCRCTRRGHKAKGMGLEVNMVEGEILEDSNVQEECHMDLLGVGE